MTEEKKSKEEREASYRKELEPYALLIGQVALAWNDLHDQLGVLFQRLTGLGSGGKAVWHSATQDRTQREMLRALLPLLPDSEYRAVAVGHIEWLLGRIEAIEQDRNNVIHASLFSNDGSNWLYDGAPQTVIPQIHLGNKRANILLKKQLMGDKLLQDYAWCRDTILVLRNFAAELEFPASYRDFAWSMVNRPTLPNRGHKSGRARNV